MAARMASSPPGMESKGRLPTAKLRVSLMRRLPLTGSMKASRGLLNRSGAREKMARSTNHRATSPDRGLPAPSLRLILTLKSPPGREVASWDRSTVTRLGAGSTAIQVGLATLRGRERSTPPWSPPWASRPRISRAWTGKRGVWLARTSTWTIPWPLATSVQRYSLPSGRSITTRARPSWKGLWRRTLATSPGA